MTTARLIPDLGGELCHALGQVEELLLTLSAWEDDPDGLAELPAPLAARVALEALNRVQDAIQPTQTLPGRPDPVGGRLLGPDGRYEHRPLRLVPIDPDDLRVLDEAAAQLGQALATNPHGELAEAMAAGAEAAASTFGPTPEPVELVTALARALGVLDLAATDSAGDTRVLAELVLKAAGADVVLSPTAEAAYQRLADRYNTMWADRDGTDRFLY
jgi:hypothetical protein